MPEARLLKVSELPGGHLLERWSVGELAQTAQPGQRLRLDAVERPLMRAGPAHGWVDCLTHAAPDFETAPAALVGAAFDLAAVSPRALLIGDIDGFAALVFLAERLRTLTGTRIKPLAVLEIGLDAPFNPAPSRIIVPGMPAWVIATLPLFEDWSIPARLCCPEDRPGCFDGPPTELARRWLDTLQGSADVSLFACGDDALLTAAAALAADRRLPFQGVTAG